MTTARTLGAITAAALLAAGCSITNVEPDEAGIVYDAGPFSSTTFEKCLKPSTRDVSGPADEGYRYPNGQRTFRFSGGETDEIKPITSASKDGATMTIYGGLTFSFAAADCAKLRKFHEEIGRKYRAYEPNGWVEMLKFYVGGPVERAMDEATLKYNWRDLYFDSAKKAEWEKEMAMLTSRYIAQIAKGDYFSGMSFILRQPEPPEDLKKANLADQVAVAQNNAQKQINEKIKTELESTKALVEVLGKDGAVSKLNMDKLAEMVASGKVSVVVVPQGGTVAVSPTK
ncbi:SPFH domain-containing protein [Nonomuraea sp. NPDC046802]|uniref:SPFH domain-containing protein n=1 Tax=Nonomuraea sp. NPDC046802 TaxID=3154919 RepID=UPI0033D370F1